MEVSDILITFSGFFYPGGYYMFNDITDLAFQERTYRIQGRPRKFTATQLRHALDLLDSGKTFKQVEAMTGISKSTLIRARKRA